MEDKEEISSYALEPTDDSPEGVAELAFILEALFADINSCRTDEELKAYLKEYLARSEEEQQLDAKAIIQNARRRFREMRGKDKYKESGSNPGSRLTGGHDEGKQ
jgi:hypothetical protein